MEDVRVSDELRHKIRLCFQEAVTNAVVHGNKYDETKYVHVSLNQNAEKLIFQIKDEGAGFDLQSIENPLEEKNLTIAGGRGLFLIKEYTESYTYLPNEKALIMEFHI